MKTFLFSFYAEPKDEESNILTKTVVIRTDKPIDSPFIKMTMGYIAIHYLGISIKSIKLKAEHNLFKTECDDYILYIDYEEVIYKEI